MFLSFKLEKFCWPIGVSVGNQLGCLESTGYAIKNNHPIGDYWKIFQLDIGGEKSNG